MENSATASSAAQTWDPDRYSRHARFVSDLGMAVVELLDPRPGERILDLGCGDGALTRRIASMGCEVVAVDSSAAQVEGARRLGLDAYVMDAENLSFEERFDAVFSNAVLHWIRRADRMMAGVRRALKPQGRFVAELGGYGCVDRIVSALSAALSRRGIDAAARNPWHFPSGAEYGRLLERAGFEVTSIALIPRPTLLPGSMADWLETFAESFVCDLPASQRAGFFREVQEELRADLCSEDGRWTADYVRLRFCARKKG